MPSKINTTANTNAVNEKNLEALQKSSLMQLQVLTPSTVFAQYDNVSSIVLETPEGSFGLLPQRQDCIAAIEPGIFTYTTQDQSPRYIAVDEGVLVKKGKWVSVSVRKALAGTDLAALKNLVQTQFVSLSEQEREVRAVLARLESGFMRGFKSLHFR